MPACKRVSGHDCVRRHVCFDASSATNFRSVTAPERHATLLLPLLLLGNRLDHNIFLEAEPNRVRHQGLVLLLELLHRLNHLRHGHLVVLLASADAVEQRRDLLRVLDPLGEALAILLLVQHVAS